MTPEQAEHIYNEAYAKSSVNHLAGISPLIQAELRKKAWQTVIDAFQKEADQEWANKYLAMEEKPRTWRL